MGNFGAEDRNVIAHEFGHIIGNPDEYYTKKYMGHAVDANTYDQVPFATDSIMNNTDPNGRVHPRHYYLIRDHYAIWKGIVPNTIEVIV
jgi:bacillopeptidase F (M6 metalloprotease family)